MYYQENYEEINGGMHLDMAHKDIGMVHQFDHIFWFGDFNYRVNLGMHGTETEFQQILEKVGATRKLLGACDT
jgi:hypothetical protein